MEVAWKDSKSRETKMKRIVTNGLDNLRNHMMKIVTFLAIAFFTI